MRQREYLAKHFFIWKRLCFKASGMLSAIESDLFKGELEVEAINLRYNFKFQ
jgi:hypothetical protein